MRRITLRLASILLYLGVLMVLMGVKVQDIFSIKIMLTLIIGTFILAVPFYSKGLKAQEMSEIVGKKALDAGYIQTFILLFVCLSKERDVTHLFWNVAMSCRALLYGYCIFTLLDTRASYKGKGKYKERLAIKNKEENEHIDDAKNLESPIHQSTGTSQSVTMEDVTTFLREQGLTKREAELAYAIMKGMTNREIAEQFYISEATVKKHVSHIFEKLQIQKREAIKELVNEKLKSQEE